MNSVLPQNYTQEEITKKYNTMLKLNPDCKADLLWWTSVEKILVGAPVHPPHPTITIHSDASTKGWGAVLNWQTWSGGQWSPSKATQHINYLEPLAAFLAIKAFGKTWEKTTITLRLDNLTAVSYINQKGGTTSRLLCQLAITLWGWCTERDIMLTAEHLPGRLNVEADKESRSTKDWWDWMLNPLIFGQIQMEMVPVIVDLFAS